MTKRAAPKKPKRKKGRPSPNPELSCIAYMEKVANFANSRFGVFILNLVILVALGLNTLYVRSVAASGDEIILESTEKKYITKTTFDTHAAIQQQQTERINETLKEIKDALSRVSVNSERLIRIETTLDSMKKTYE